MRTNVGCPEVFLPFQYICRFLIPQLVDNLDLKRLMCTLTYLLRISIENDFIPEAVFEHATGEIRVVRDADSDCQR
jgi:hypothetical protein